MSVTIEHRGYTLTASGSGASRRWTATHAVYGPVLDGAGRHIAYRNVFRLMFAIDCTFRPPPPRRSDR